MTLTQELVLNGFLIYPLESSSSCSIAALGGNFKIWPIIIDFFLPEKKKNQQVLEKKTDFLQLSYLHHGEVMVFYFLY